jgi:hypothetical protein
MKKNMQICWLSNMQTFTVKIYSIFFFTLSSQLALAQLLDDFSDDNFTQSPTWAGTDSLFVVNGARLRLNGGDDAGVAYLATGNNLFNRSTWEFAFSFEFNPSTANHARVYLISDKADLTGPLNGIFVMLGGNEDRISLYRQTALTYTEIIGGRDGLLNLPSIAARVKVTHDDTGWKLFTDMTYTGNYALEGEGHDQTNIDSQFFGIMCTYSATRSDKFFFDNFNVSQRVAVDSLPPVLLDIQVISSSEVHLIFSEPLEAQSATNVHNYVIADEQYATEAILSEDSKTVFLRLSEPLEEKKHSITISGVMDLDGNTMGAFQTDFIYLSSVEAKAKDVIISEILPDPLPSIGLGDSEFIEIYNRSDKTFDLSGWSISDGSSTAILPSHLLLPKTYLVLTSMDSKEIDFKHVLLLKGFPSLNNSNDALILKAKNGTIIDSVNYLQSWYRDADKAEGGWTLEILDPDNICSEHENWSASEDDRGGTPGSANSVFTSRPDVYGPLLTSAFAVNSSTVVLNFNEKLEKPLSSAIAITIDPVIPVEKLVLKKNLIQLEISTSQEIQPGITYTVSIANAKDCAGNMMPEDSREAIFGLPQAADSLDVVINEILFNPSPTGVDFVEIHNNSIKFINLKGWSIGNPDTNKATVITDTDLVFAPGDYLALTNDAEILRGEYLLSLEKTFLQVETLPAFDDDAGAVDLADDEHNTIDFFQYSKDMHSAFLKDDEGVSLERITNTGSSASQNWRSASSTVGFATPGSINSNTIDYPTIMDPVTVEPEIFNPLGGAINFALIHYNFDRGGYVANVKIFDSQGRNVKGIANNDILGTRGFYRWDGDRDDGTKASLGYYMVWFEIFEEQGIVKRYLKRIAVATSFK